MADAGRESPDAAKARKELKDRYEHQGFVSPLHALSASEVSAAAEAFRRFESVHRRRLIEYDSAREMNHAWLPWLRDLARHSAIVAAVRDAFCTRNVCLYASELLALPPSMSPTSKDWDWRADAPAFSLLLKPVDRRHFATVSLALSTCDQQHGGLRVRPTAVGGRASNVDIQLHLRPGEFSLHGPSTKYSMCPNNSSEVLYVVVLRYVRASTTDPLAESLGKEDVLLVSGKDDQGHFEEMPEFPAEASDDGRDLRQLMMEQREEKSLAGEVLKGREGLKRPLLDASSYSLEETILYGTFKTIHVGRLKASSGGQKVVVKRVRSQKLVREVRKHFHEARMLEKLVHPCIVRMLGVVDSFEQLDVLLEYCEGGPLTSYVQQRPRSCSLQVMCDLLCALAYMHREDLAHLDVKPNNVLVSADRGKLCDFETAMQMPRSHRAYLVGVGTPGYRAPEIDRSMECDAMKADVWSLGMVGEFTEQYVKGCWRGMELLIAEEPELRPSMKASLDMYKKLHGSSLILS